MEDIQTMQEMLRGLEARKKSLKDDEKVFLKVSGINEEIEKASQDKISIVSDSEKAKKERDDLKKKKADAVSKTTDKISESMNSVLPFGSAVFTYDEDETGKRDLHIGWKVDGVTTPYNGLSGGQKQAFDAALAHVLNASIIVLEAAELDSDNLPVVLNDLGQLDKQILVSTWYPIDNIPEPFVRIDVGEAQCS